VTKAGRAKVEKKITEGRKKKLAAAATQSAISLTVLST